MFNISQIGDHEKIAKAAIFCGKFMSDRRLICEIQLECDLLHIEIVPSCI